MRAMKDSGVEWIGEIPAEWEIGKVKKYYKIATGFTPNTQNIDYYDDNGVDWITISDLDNGYYIPEVTKSHISKKYLELYNPTIIPKGSLLYSFKLSVGQVAFTNRDIFTNEAIASFLPTDNVNLKYLYYSSMFIIENSQNNIYGAKLLNKKLINNAYIVFPPLHEQQRIADYLDKKCAEIDAIISKQHSIIEKLQEYKLSLITETVTKGLNADAEMKDSGIEWIGETPKHWDLIKIGIVCKTSSGATPSRKQDSDFYVDNANIPWIKTLDLNDGLVYDSTEKISEIALENSSCTIMPMNTVCVAMYGGAGTIGKCGLLKIRASTNQAVCSLECSNKIIPLFLLFQILTLRKYWMKYAVGTRKDPNISQDIVNRMKIVLPPIMEQEEIAKFINLKSQKIDELIQRKQYLIDKLTEYKKSLIYEVVTGKKEV